MGPRPGNHGSRRSRRLRGGHEEEEPVRRRSPTPPAREPRHLYEPDLMLEKHDEFWPVAVRTIDLLRSGHTRTCLPSKRDARASRPIFANFPGRPARTSLSSTIRPTAATPTTSAKESPRR